MSGKEPTNYNGHWYPSDPVWGMDNTIHCRGPVQALAEPPASHIIQDLPGPLQEDYTLYNEPLQEDYIIKDGDVEADYYNMRGRGPFLLSSTGQYYRRPSTYPVGGPGYFGPMTLRAGKFIPTPDYRYMRRLRKASRHSPLAFMWAQDYDYAYPGLSGSRL